MDATRIRGIWPASLTPFGPSGDIDHAALRTHLAELASTPGVQAVVVNGHAGEATSLSPEERRDVVALARSVAPAGSFVVAGIIADDARTAIAQGREAAAAGADALLLFPAPALAAGGTRRAEMALRFVGDVAESAGLPICLFQLSLVTGQGWPTDILERLCREVPAIVAVKEGSDVPAAYEDTLAALRRLDRKVAVLTTNNTWLMASLALGGDGILSGMGSVASPILAEIFSAMERGDLAAARTANSRLAPLRRAFYRPPFCDMHTRMKTALHLLGRLPDARPRPPLLPLTADEGRAIEFALEEAGLLGAGRRPHDAA